MKSAYEVAKGRIRDKSAQVTVIGAGYVGLPTAALLAEVGFRVDLVDINASIVKTVNSGDSPFTEPGLAELVRRVVKNGRLKATSELDDAIRVSDILIIAVQTPIDSRKSPDLSMLDRAISDIGGGLRNGMLALVTSTVPPGTIMKRVKPRVEKLSGLASEKDFYLAYTPERIAPGNAIEDLRKGPRLVGGVGPRSAELAALFTKKVCRDVVECDVRSAEISKTAENSFRDVNIAFANQLALICEKSGADVSEVIRLANTHPRVNILDPGPGVGGPCLTKDPYFLVSGASLGRYNIPEIARRVNDSMPGHVVELASKALKSAGKDPRASKVTILGTTYKSGIDDTRESPARPVVAGMAALGADVVTYDPDTGAGLGVESAPTLDEAVAGSDCLIIMTDNKVFRKLDLKKVRDTMRGSPCIVDCRRILDAEKAARLGFVYTGIGRDNIDG
jgi:UDP-N-acetyl-D-mannosaminuronic acid dehydrogenase